MMLGVRMTYPLLFHEIFNLLSVIVKHKLSHVGHVLHDHWLFCWLLTILLNIFNRHVSFHFQAVASSIKLHILVHLVKMVNIHFTFLCTGNFSLGDKCNFWGLAINWLKAGVSSKQFWNRLILANT